MAGPAPAGDLAAARDLLARLVAFDTTSALPNRALIDFVAAYLAEHAIESHIIPDETGDKASLLATVGPAVPGGVVLSGHTDVVPVAGQAWTVDPFTLTERAGRLIGRGTCDMKGFVACALALVPASAARDLRVPLHLAFSYDEEVGCLAAPALLARAARVLPPPALAVIGEPSEMRVANRHRGIHAYLTTVRGKPAHASDPEAGANAIAAAAAIVGEIMRLGAEHAAAARDTAQDTAGPREPGTAPEHTTVNVGTIEGGTALNIIAEHCRLAWEVRPAAGESADAIRARIDAFAAGTVLPALRATAPEAAIDTTETVAVPGLEPLPGSPAEELLLALTGQNACTAVPFASEAGQFQAAGIPAVVCGPGSPTQAHQPDEYVTIDQLEACLALLHRLADWAAA